MTPKERAAAIATACGTKALTFSQNGVNFSVSNVVAIGPTVWFDANAWTGQGANKVYLPIDPDPDPVSGRPYGITNPPLQVPDGGFDANGRPTVTRNDVAAAKATVYGVVVGYALAHGWTP